ncbi:MAG: methylmalonyl-CoA mutase family protein, partial [Ignavibacteria bacterium]|nr:methylmalonyl-CoA mutase family protein [Ignavibacteria bacterium]
IESGFVQTEIQNAAYRFTQEMEQGTRVVVGVNRFQSEEHGEERLLTIDMRVQRDQIASLHAVRQQRSATAVTNALRALSGAAAGEANLVPAILDAVRVYASVGEICDTMRSVFGEYREKVTI